MIDYLYHPGHSRAVQFPYFRRVKLSLTIAYPDDAAAISALMNEAAQELTSRYGKGHWSYEVSEKSIKTGILGHSKVLIAKHDTMIVGTLRLTAKKPWAIDPAYFTKVSQPVYLVDMAVSPGMQRKGIGKYMLEQSKSFAASWPAQAIRLDAYDNVAGAGDFYRKSGFTEKGRVVYRRSALIYFEWLT